MSSPVFSRTSLTRLETCHPLIQLLSHEILQYIDVSVVCGWRSEAEQMKAFNEGNSKLRWPDSKHNFMRDGKPYSLAVDLAPWVPGEGIAWTNRERFGVMGGIALVLADKMGIRIRWGGAWNGGPYFGIRGQNWDMPHIELVHPIF